MKPAIAAAPVVMVLMLLALPHAAMARKPPPPTHVFGAGTAPCAVFRDATSGDLNTPAANFFLSWLDGYMTAVAQKIPSTDRKLTAMDPSGWMRWINAYCTKNPRTSFYGAANRLVFFLVRRHK
ncbi:MAG: hypothetical protein KGJ41_15530 [Rhodospirillales bacterium]|nr:hypothetical protein [Rhodospirillales bacterium]